MHGFASRSFKPSTVEFAGCFQGKSTYLTNKQAFWAGKSHAEIYPWQLQHSARSVFLYNAGGLFPCIWAYYWTQRQNPSKTTYSINFCEWNGEGHLWQWKSQIWNKINNDNQQSVTWWLTSSGNATKSGEAELGMEQSGAWYLLHKAKALLSNLWPHNTDSY